MVLCMVIRDIFCLRGLVHLVPIFPGLFRLGANSLLLFGKRLLVSPIFGGACSLKGNRGGGRRCITHTPDSHLAWGGANVVWPESKQRQGIAWIAVVFDLSAHANII